MHTRPDLEGSREIGFQESVTESEDRTSDETQLRALRSSALAIARAAEENDLAARRALRASWSEARHAVQRACERSLADRVAAAELAIACASLASFDAPMHDVLELLERAGSHPLPTSTMLALQVRKGVVLRMLGRLSETADVLEPIVAQLPHSRDRARTLVELAAVRAFLGKLEEASAAAVEGLEVARQTDDAISEGMALCGIGGVMYSRGMIDGSRQAFEAAAMAAARISDQPRQAWYLTNLGQAHLTNGAIELALQGLSQAVEAATRAEAPVVAAYAQVFLSKAHLAQGERERAKELLEEARYVLSESGRALELGFCLSTLGELARAERRLDVAQRLFAESIERSSGVDPGTAEQTRAQLAAVLASSGRMNEAEQRFVAAERGLDRASYGDATRMVVELERGHLDLARALLVFDADAVSAKKWRERAIARLNHVIDLPERRWLAVREARVRLENAIEAYDAMAHSRRTTLRIGSGCRWLRAGDGELVDLERRHVLRRVLQALLDGHERGAGLTIDDLATEVYVDEKMDTLSARNRLYVALNQLRKLGLEGIIRVEQGLYSLHAEVDLSAQSRPPDGRAE